MVLLLLLSHDHFRVSVFSYLNVKVLFRYYLAIIYWSLLFATLDCLPPNPVVSANDGKAIHKKQLWEILVIHVMYKSQQKCFN